MARITERWMDRQFTRGRSARQVFDIDSGPTDETEAQVALATDLSIDAGTAFTLDPSLTVPSNSIDIATIRPGYYRATVPFQSNASTTGDTTALFSKKWQVLPAELISEDVDADTTYDGNVVLDSSTSPFDQNIKRKREWFRFRMRRYEAGTDLLAKNLAYHDRWNNDSVTLPRYGAAAAKTLLFKSALQVDSQEQGTSTGVLVEYTFEARPTRDVSYDGFGGTPIATTIHGWHTRRVDKSIYGLALDGSDGIPVQLYSLRPPAGPLNVPICLDGRGRPLRDLANYKCQKPDGTFLPFVAPTDVPDGCVLESTPFAVFLNFDCTEGPIAFSGLSIAANN